MVSATDDTTPVIYVPLTIGELAAAIEVPAKKICRYIHDQEGLKNMTPGHTLYVVSVVENILRAVDRTEFVVMKTDG